MPGEEKEFFLPIGSEELGVQRILRRVPRPPWLHLTAESQMGYTSNVFLTEDNPRGDWIFTQTLGMTITPRKPKKPTLSLFYRHQWLRYMHNDELDFDVDNAGFTLTYPMGKQHALYGGYSGLRLVSQFSDEEFFREGDAMIGFRTVQTVGKRWVFFGGLQLDYRHASPSLYDRLTHMLYIGGRVGFGRNFAAEITYRLQYEDFLHEPREDIRNNLSASLIYLINQHISLRATVSETWNDSSMDGRTYDMFNGGLSLILTGRF